MTKYDFYETIKFHKKPKYAPGTGIASDFHGYQPLHQFGRPIFRRHSAYLPPQSPAMAWGKVQVINGVKLL